MSPVVAWPTFDGLWESSVRNVAVDCGGDVVVDGGQYRVHLEDVGWNEVAFDFEATTAEELPQGMSVIIGLVLVACPATNSRVPFPLHPVGNDPRRLAGRVILGRAAVERTATVTALLVGTVAGRGRVVARSVPWTIVVASISAPQRPGEPPISQVWVDFAQVDAPPMVRKFPDSYSYLEYNSDRPILYLNSGIEGLQTVLTSPRPKNEKRRLQAILGAEIARYTTKSLVTLAVNEIALDDDDLLPPRDRVLQQTCEAIAGEIARFASVDEFYRAVAKAQTTAELAEIWAEIDAAVGRLTGSSEAVATALKEVQYG